MKVELTAVLIESVLHTPYVTVSNGGTRSGQNYVILNLVIYKTSSYGLGDVGYSTSELVTLGSVKLWLHFVQTKKRIIRVSFLFD